jgi:broad specificity phosphatase PhoE
MNGDYAITLLRHGESAGNAENIYQGKHDYPLTDNGRLQARLLAERWQAEGKRFDRIIASPLLRAWETAQIVAEHLPTEIEPDPNWMERDFGKLSGLNADQAEVQYPRPAYIGLYDPVAVTGETQWELYLRAGRAVQDLLNRPPGAYLVTSHGGILNMAMHAILGVAPFPDYQGPYFHFRNTAFTTLIFTPSRHAWRLDGFNDQRHWEDYKLRSAAA